MGRPKAWLPFGGETMLQRVVWVVKAAVNPVVVVAAPGQDVPELPPNVRILRDEVEDNGPLAGLAAGLAALEGEADAAYLSSCDVPFLTPEFVRRMVELLSGERPGLSRPSAVVPEVGGRPHPLAAAYRASVLPVVRGSLAAGRLRLLDLFDQIPTRFVAESELPDLRSLRNVNTPDEYAAALRELAAPTG
jgi:molybdopterin-guanine dinucleotide biosynthesis protein A